ncbi:phosphotransferase family protein [Nonomuraea endophytica]|uniref:Aminoglycoside phosphotransferase (APT) family kinase protein n=1 Tax=Nonomuraea endophytica TaxID=714136 RepID=A0A7W8EMV7_9ACTN|nr:phosphotransferase [Nonomuraea endophytica]MBB5085076.1 aminoglycoside phosphotransferase (APT) family kinase protein [Nonomuraea endophytica]
MVLGLSELTGYLLDRQHVHPDAVVDGGLGMVDASSRHSNVIVRADPAVGLFIKQGRSDPVQPVTGWTGPGTTAHEAAVYALLDSLARRHPSSRASVPVPRCLGFDADHGVLVLELFPDASDLLTHHARTRRFPVTLGTRLGAALADLHEHATGPARERPSEFPGYLPWALRLDRPGTAFYRQMSNAGLGLVRIVQSSPELRAALAELRAGWRTDAFIHHDLKLDNCVVLAAGTSGRHTRLALVDWELGNLGDACWDTGSIFSSYLHHWLISFPLTGSEQPDHYLDQARFPLGRMHKAMRAFWATYVRVRGWDSATADAALIRSIRYAGARLLQTACERTKPLSRVSTVVVCLTQLAENVLARPEEAAEHLLGLSPREGSDE